MNENFSNVEQLIGNTPILELSLGLDNKIKTYMKLEGSNPTGSIKDRAALFIIKDKLKKKKLIKGKTILDASSGSFACAISYLGNILGFPVVTVTGSKMTEDKLNFVNYFGGRNIKINANFTIDCNRYCSEVLLKENPEQYCFLDQLHNWENPKAHYETTAPEILERFPNVSAVVFSIGSGGTICGVSKFFKKFSPKTKIIAITASKGTKIPGTAGFLDGEYETPFIKEFNEDNRIDYTAVVSMEDAINNVLELRSRGVYAGIQTGGVVAGTINAIKELGISGDIVMISGDAGWKNSDKLKSII